MNLRLSNNETINLPSDLNLEQRKELVEKILSEHSEDFKYNKKFFDTKYGKKTDNDNIVKVRLDILGTYILKADPKYTETIMSQSKIRSRQRTEIPLSCFKIDDNEDNFLDLQEIYKNSGRNKSGAI